MKTCTKCKIEKPKAEFSKGSKNQDGLQYNCNTCCAAYRKANSERLRARNAEYYAANKEIILAQKSAYYFANSAAIIAKTAAHQSKNKDSVSARKAKHYADNKSTFAAKHAAYRAANREKIRVRRAYYYGSKKEEFQIYRRKRYAENKETYLERARNRRARKRNAEGTHTASDIRSIFEKQQGLCANCQIKLSKSGRQRYHVDHIMPLALGGSNWPENLQCLCPSCNLSKGAKHPDEWAAQNGRLI